VDITYRTLGPWGSGKGANLQPSEVDTNFWSLAEAIVALQTNPAQPVGIASITVSGTQMYISLTDGTVLGPFTLPVLSFRWRGEWEAGADYVALDVISVEFTGIFMCQVSHTSGATFDINQEIGGTLVWLQLFGSVDASLSGLSDVYIDPVESVGDALVWTYHDGGIGYKWTNRHLGDLAFQEPFNVAITGGSITGMAAPVNPGDVVNKAYVDALPAGMTSGPGTMMANASTVTGPAIPTHLSDYLDYVFTSTVAGTIIYRSSTSWTVLPPGTSGQFLKTNGPGLDPAWAPGGSGVTSITAGTGISTGAGPIVATGTVSLDPVPDRNFLSNISGASAPPTPHTLSAFLDVVLSNARGSVLTRTIGGWVSLAPGLIGQTLTSQGASADLIWTSPAGGGTVTSINAGSGISTGGAPITGSGSVSLASVANQTLLANISGSSTAPTPTALSALFDAILGSAQGSVLYRAATGWAALGPGTNGQVLTSGGSAANPAWAAAVTGAPIASLNMLANLTGGTATATGQTVSAVLDAVFSSARGSILFRGASAWQALAPGTSGQLLQTGGSSGNPSWTTVATGGARVTVSDTAPTSPAPVAGDLWWCSAVGVGQLFVYYTDPDSSAWIQANSAPATTGASATQIDAYTTAGTLTWTKPAGAVAVTVILYGGGGGGGAGVGAAAGSARGGGSGGGGGASVIRTFAAADLGVSETVTIGAGGGGATTSAGNGIAGGNTAFGTRFTSFGGGAGRGGGTTLGSSGGSGGGSGGPGNAGSTAAAVGGLPTTSSTLPGVGGGGGASQMGAEWGGGGGGSSAANGGAGAAAGPSLYGAGGGGAAGGITTGNAAGTSGAGGGVNTYVTTVSAGGGGAAGAATGAVGSDGTAGNSTRGGTGGGGGGANTSGTGGKGGNGAVPGGGGGGGGGGTPTQGNGGDGGAGSAYVITYF
jgi:hypothetical protein